MPEFDKKTMEILTSKDPSPEDQARCRELRGILESSFDAIPEIYRSVFLLREVEGLSTMEAAECLGISEETVKTRLHRARGLLRQELFERAGYTGDYYWTILEVDPEWTLRSASPASDHHQESR